MIDENLANSNWEHWLYIVNLEPHFPELPPLTGDDFERKFYQRPENEIGMNDILAAISGAAKTKIVFTPGHGATTMFQAVLRRLNSQPTRRLHVPIDVAKYLGEDEEIGDVLWEHIHRDIFRQLMTSDSFTHLHGTRRTSFQILFDQARFSNFIDYFNSTRARLLHAKPGSDEENKLLASFRYAPSISSLGDLFHVLLIELGVETVLLFDVPRTANTQALLSLMGEVKAFDEQVRIRAQFPKAALTEVYFGTSGTLGTLEATYHRDYQTVEVPPYNMAEGFAILTKHYGVRYVTYPIQTQSLITILSASYLDDVWSSSKSLSEMMRDLKLSLLNHLDCPRNKVSFGMFQDPAQAGGKQ
jgi:hypothetical protein